MRDQCFDEHIVSGAVVDYPLNPTIPSEWKVFIRPQTPIVGLELVSFVPAGGMAEGSNLCIVNDSADDIVLKHNDVRGAANCRIYTSNGQDFVLTPGRPIWCVLFEESTSHSNGWYVEAA
jgi:hypothetical protein